MSDDGSKLYAAAYVPNDDLDPDSYKEPTKEEIAIYFPLAMMRISTLMLEDKISYCDAGLYFNRTAINATAMAFLYMKNGNDLAKAYDEFIEALIN